MGTLRLKRALAGVALVAGLMAMALSCGGADESAAMAMEDSAAYAPAQPAAAQPTAAPEAASGSMTESLGLDRSPLAQAATAVQQASAGADSDTPTGESASSMQAQSGRQLIVEAWVSLEVNDIDSVARQVETLAAQRGGWVESSDIVGEGGYRTASIGIRVPAERFNNAMDTLRGLGRVTDEGVSSTDVTDRLIDNEARMEAWKVQEERLVVLLENAATVEDVIDIERRISEVRADIEQVAATQRNLENRVAASLIRVNLHLPPRFAADPPYGSLTLAVGNPAETADSVVTQVEALQGYVGEKREYQEDRGQVVQLSAFVRPTDLNGLMDYVASLGEPSERRLDSVGPAPSGDTPNARLTLVIRSNVDSAASLSLEASEPMAMAGEIRARVESLGGYVENWNESRWDEGESVSINADLVVKASDLREIMDFGAGLGKVVAWEYHSSGQSPSDAAPNSRLSVSVYTGDDRDGIWVVVGVIIAVLAIAGAGGVIALVMWQRRRRSGAEGNGVSQRQPPAADDGDGGNGNAEV
ncbi:MAG: DUF4349 domain-containing protein [Chloroflexi bacterium]|nr:DUF4349 domain-containing protein [Chloroflexota bacterium]MYD49597.1 DUF4349 domain-containing protein [Chloroflexota bacterium]